MKNYTCGSLAASTRNATEAVFLLAAGPFERLEPPIEAVEFATLDWVNWFNNRRLLEPIGFIPPAEAEERYFASLNDKARAA